MSLEKKPTRTVRPMPASFRLSKEAILQLKALSAVLNMSQTEIIEGLLSVEFDRCKKKHSGEMQKVLTALSKKKV